MSATSMGVASKGGKAPDRGSFPLDHFSECKCAPNIHRPRPLPHLLSFYLDDIRAVLTSEFRIFMEKFMQCMKEHDGVHMHCHQQTKVIALSPHDNRPRVFIIFCMTSGLFGLSNGQRSDEERG
jgi:hypothetical protein